jgi:hypothetical protein
MSQENVEVVRRTIDSFNTSEIDRVLGGVGDAFEIAWSNSIGPLKGIDRGREETLKLASPSATRGTHYGGNPKEIIDVGRGTGDCCKPRPDARAGQRGSRRRH